MFKKLYNQLYSHKFKLYILELYNRIAGTGGQTPVLPLDRVLRRLGASDCDRAPTGVPTAVPLNIFCYPARGTREQYTELQV